MKGCIHYQILVHQFVHNLDLSMANKEVVAILLAVYAAETLGVGGVEEKGLVFPSLYRCLYHFCFPKELVGAFFLLLLLHGFHVLKCLSIFQQHVDLAIFVYVLFPHYHFLEIPFFGL